MEQRPDCAAGDNWLVDTASSSGAALVHGAAVAGRGRGAARGEGQKMAAAQFEALQRQAQVRVRRDAEGGHAARARQEDH